VQQIQIAQIIQHVGICNVLILVQSMILAHLVLIARLLTISQFVHAQMVTLEALLQSANFVRTKFLLHRGISFLRILFSCFIEMFLHGFCMIYLPTIYSTQT
jgi:hypothetical protein